MKKFTFLAIVAAFAMVAAPALAEQSVGGYYRLQGVQKTDGLAKDANEINMIDQRLRMKYTNKLTDDVSFVYYAEIDTPWGSPGKTIIQHPTKGRIQDTSGQLGTDGVNVETKNAYATFKVGDTKLTTGLQTIADSYEGLVIFHDAAAIKAEMDVSGAAVTLVYSKFSEGATATKDDQDFFAATYKRDALTVSLYDFTSQNGDAGDRTDEFVLGATYNFGAGNVYGLYNFGVNTAGTDVAAMAFGADYKVDGVGQFKFQYISADDDANDDGVFKNSVGGFSNYKDGLSIFTYDIYYNNAGAYNLSGMSVNSGYGLMSISMNNMMSLDNDMYLKYAAGYFMLANDDPKGAAGKAEGTDLGLEVAAQVGKKFDKADLSLRAAYAMLGSAFDGSAAGGADPDDVMQIIAMVNIGF